MRNSKEYMREYMLKRYYARIDDAKKRLGGKCAKCGAKEKLQFDHIDPITKLDTISNLWNYTKERLDAELSKCQLLCCACHEEKTLNDLGRVSAKNTHGTLSSYRYCRCDLCKKVKSDHHKKWRAKRKLDK